MPSTRMRALRTKKGLTQRQLAAAVGTSQQQIQRIETGAQAPRFDLAARICAALEEPMEQVFPTTKKPMAALRRKGLTEQSIFRDHEFGAEMESAGIDMDPAVWTFKLRLRGGAMKALPVSGPEKKRLWSAVQDATGFVVFDSSEKRIALNLHHLLFCQFLFDAPFAETVVDEDEDKNCDLEVFLSESEEPLAFSVEPDLSSRGAESGGDETQLRDLLFMAESSCDENDVLCFTDVDGETAFFRAADVAMISIPISAVEPDLFEAEDDDDPANSG